MKHLWIQWIIALIFMLSVDSQGIYSHCGEKPPQAPWTSRITGGRQAAPGSWPWQVSLAYKYSETESVFKHACGAVLIDLNWILCVAHCVDPEYNSDARRSDPANYRAVLGAHSLNTPSSTEQILQIDLITMHAGWKPLPELGYPNDIAMMRLTQNINLTPGAVWPACVPETAQFNFTGHPDCWISGWGKTHWQSPDVSDILNEAKTEILSNQECQDLDFGTIVDTHICAGWGYPNVCAGDSGGPVSCLENGRWYVAGLASWTIVFCDGTPAVNTRVTKFWDWITVNIALNTTNNDTLNDLMTPY